MFEITFGPLKPPKKGGDNYGVWLGGQKRERTRTCCVGVRLDVFGLSYVVVMKKRVCFSKRKGSRATVSAPFNRRRAGGCGHGGTGRRQAWTLSGRERSDLVACVVLRKLPRRRITCGSLWLLGRIQQKALERESNIWGCSCTHKWDQ